MHKVLVHGDVEYDILPFFEKSFEKGEYSSYVLP